MPGTIERPLLPEEAIALGPRLAAVETPEELIFMNASGPLMSGSRQEATAKRYLGAVFLSPGLATGDDLTAVLGIHRSTLFRHRKLYREGGLEAIRDGRGHGAPRCAHKLTDEALATAQGCLDEGGSPSAAARAVGVSETAIRHAIKSGRLRARRRPPPGRAALSPRERAVRDAAPAQGAGTAVKRLEEPALACQGKLPEAAPHFAPVEAVANAGVLLALPAIVGEELLRRAERVYAPLKAGFYGLQSILLCLVLMAEPADPERVVPNPERRPLEKSLKAKPVPLGRAHVRQAKPTGDGTAVRKKDPHQQMIERLGQECDQRRERLHAMAKRVPLKSIHEANQIVHHESERKTITQIIKIVAYRSESSLASLVEPGFARHDDVIRAFLKAVFRLPGDIIPDDDRGQRRVRLYGMANNRSQQALLTLCEILNAQQIDYPGTDLRLVYEAIQSH